MKSKRHSAILEIIERSNVETQEDLIDNLRREGFNVTQATVSRDIRELRLTKIMGDGGKYKYVLPGRKDSSGHYVYSEALAASVISVDCAMNLVIIRTYPGMAQAVAAGIDTMNISGIMGSVAGDDTIFVAVRDPELAAKAASDVRKIVGK